jgi:hypothetical protein
MTHQRSRGGSPEQSLAPLSASIDEGDPAVFARLPTSEPSRRSPGRAGEVCDRLRLRDDAARARRYPDSRRRVDWGGLRAAIGSETPPAKLDLTRQTLSLRERGPAAFAGSYEAIDAGLDACAFLTSIRTQ